MTGISENNCNRKKLLLEKNFQVNGFQQRENPSPIARIKDFFKNTFLVHGKKFSLAVTFRKHIKSGQFEPENPFPLPGMKQSLKIRFHYTKKMLLVARKLKKMVSTSRKMFYF